VDVSGDAKGDCFNGTAHITTVEPLTFLVGESCFRAGQLRVETIAGTMRVTINGDASIDVDANDDGTPETHYDSCASLPATCDL
jgi:hypothetical protein